ncbi:MAG: hypothetical protein V4640_00570 [Verrucomicrobiota bacterium]
MAAIVMDLANFGNTLDIVAHRDSFARRRHSKALPMVFLASFLKFVSQRSPPARRSKQARP